MHEPVPQVGKWLKTVVEGHNRYYGVPSNSQELSSFSFSGSPTLVSVAEAAEPADAAHVGTDVPIDRPMAATAANPSPLSLEATWRHHLRQEPDALVTLVRICGGGD